MAGSVWSGYLTFGLVSIPVKLYPAARSVTISFNMLHKGCGMRVKQQLTCPEHGVLSRDDIVKGYEYEKNRYVEVQPEEIKKIEPPTARTMEIMEFVPDKQVDPLYFDSSYYLVPDDPGRRAYALLRKALQGSNMLGIAKVTMHNREYTVILRPLGEEGIAIHSMFYQNEVRSIQELGQTDHTEVREKELELANSLIENLKGEFEPDKYHDGFQENVKQMLEAKLEGREVEEVAKPKLAPVVDLMAALKQSLKQAQSMPRKAAARASEAEPAEAPAEHRRTASRARRGHRARNG